jgi:hypothetical protein
MVTRISSPDSNKSLEEGNNMASSYKEVYRWQAELEVRSLND